MNERTPGWKTTEFWLSLLAAVIGLVSMSGAIPAGTGLEQVVGQVITILAALGYTVSRTVVKVNDED